MNSIPTIISKGHPIANFGRKMYGSYFTKFPFNVRVHWSRGERGDGSTGSHWGGGLLVFRAFVSIFKCGGTVLNSGVGVCFKIFNLFILFSTGVYQGLSPFFNFPFRGANNMYIFPGPFLHAFCRFRRFLYFYNAQGLNLAFLLPRPTSYVSTIAMGKRVRSLLFRRDRSICSDRRFTSVVHSFHQTRVRSFLTTNCISSTVFREAKITTTNDIRHRAIIGRTNKRYFQEGFLTFLLNIFSSVNMEKNNRYTFHFFTNIR